MFDEPLPGKRDVCSLAHVAFPPLQAGAAGSGNCVSCPGLRQIGTQALRKAARLPFFHPCARSLRDSGEGAASTLNR
jgi:hypothetical protein